MAGRETFGKRLKRLREERGLTAVALAEACGVADGTIRQIEGGKVKSPSLHLGIRLADALDVDVRYLALGEDGLAARVRALERRVEALEGSRPRASDHIVR